MVWKILVFETAHDDKPVEDFIQSQNPSTIAKIAHVIDLLESHGPLLSMPHAKKLTDKLYELRIRGKQEIRIIYSFVNKIIYLLHAFKKEKMKIPKKEIETASRRLKNLKLVA